MNLTTITIITVMSITAITALIACLQKPVDFDLPEEAESHPDVRKMADAMWRNRK